MFRKILLVLFIFMSDQALAVPEAARYGKFSCVACHVSPGGGGTLTNYGRMFSAEKLSTWSFDGEENLLYSLVRPREDVLAGGDARWVYDQRQNSNSKFKKFWRMQTDLELAVHQGDFWFQGTMGTKPAGPMDDPKEHSTLVHRGYSFRYDLFDEHVLVRAGLFAPRFGLMTDDHTAFSRMALGLGPDDAQTQGEITYQDDQYEVFASALLQSNAYDRVGKSKTGFNLGFAANLGNRQRVGVGLLRTEKKRSETTNVMTGLGVSSVITATKKLFALLELDRVSNQTRGMDQTLKTDAVATFLTVNYEVFRGFSPYLRHEYWDWELGSRDNGITRYGGGINWYPRPHIQTELRSLITKLSSEKESTSETDLTLHYYF